MTRCVNLDWLEVFCLEDSISFPHDADFFRRAGFQVSEREYGTPVYSEMFTLLDHYANPIIEIRRSPKSAIGRQLHGVLDPMACHVRLTNRSCYFDNAATMLQQFLEKYGLHYQRVSRVDIALDFTKFDFGDDPAVFMRRYMAGRYSKINQANISAHGSDRWDGRTWNSVAWGERKSMVGTKFYNKSLELKQVHDKPYIRQAWCAAGLIDDPLTGDKRLEDGTIIQPDVWRVEFSIKSSTRNWFVIEDYTGQRKKVRSIRNTLDCYKSREQVLQLFLSLADHYFHFKKYREGVRKDRCEDKRLFSMKEVEHYYKLENIATTNEPSKTLSRLYARLKEYIETTTKPDVLRAGNIILGDIEWKQRTASLAQPWQQSELEALRLLIARRMKSQDRPLSEDIATVEALLGIEMELFHPADKKTRPKP